MSNNLQIKKFEDKDTDKWDSFIFNNSFNGTILQTRQFLNYHKKDRFIDNSLMIIKGENNLIALIPGCVVFEEEKKVFSSHPGSTFGGIILDRNYVSISIVKEIIEIFESYLIENKFQKVILKQTGEVFSESNSDLIYYFLFNKNYKHYDELSFCIDYKNLKGNVLDNMKSKTRNEYRFAVKSGLCFKKLEDKDEIKSFYEILCKSLLKYNTKPVHTYEEIIQLHELNLKDKVEFYGVFKDNIMIAGSMVFLFKNVFHTQYLAADSDYLQFKPMNFLDGKLIEEGFKRNFGFFSFGISTEEHGKFLNESLAKFKEGFGTGFYINKSFYKEL